MRASSVGGRTSSTRVAGGASSSGAQASCVVSTSGSVVSTGGVSASGRAVSASGVGVLVILVGVQSLLDLVDDGRHGEVGIKIRVWMGLCKR